MNIQFNYGDLIIALVGILIGYFLSSLGYLFDLFRRRRNIKKMILEELISNYTYINKAYPKKKDETNPLLIVHVLAAICSKMQTAVYDNYLNRIDTLKRKDVQCIFHAYKSIRHSAVSAEDLMNIKLPLQNKNEIAYQHSFEIMLKSIDETYDNLRIAICQLEDEKTAEQIEKLKGSEIDSIAKMYSDYNRTPNTN